MFRNISACSHGFLRSNNLLKLILHYKCCCAAGHSLGGGVAALVTLLLQQPGAAPRSISGVRCVCIGPAAVLSEELCALCEQYITTVVVGADVIPRLRWVQCYMLLVGCSAATLKSL
jgi:hypothetical protein